MGYGSGLGRNPEGVRKQSSSDHQDKAEKLERQEQACQGWKLRDIIKAEWVGGSE